MITQQIRQGARLFEGLQEVAKLAVHYVPVSFLAPYLEETSVLCFDMVRTADAQGFRWAPKSLERFHRQFCPFCTAIYDADTRMGKQNLKTLMFGAVPARCLTRGATGVYPTKAVIMPGLTVFSRARRS